MSKDTSRILDPEDVETTFLTGHLNKRDKARRTLKRYDTVAS